MSDETARGRREVLDMLDDRHHDEWEMVHGAYGVEELPSQLDARHERERANFERRLDLLPPKPGEFATLDDYIRASDPLVQDDLIAGRHEILSMLDAEIREDIRLWAEDWIDDVELADLKVHHREVREDVEQRLADYQPISGEFVSLEAFMSATEHLAAYGEAADMAQARTALQAPEFSRDTIAAEPWTAVRLPVPPDADRELLEHARGWASDLTRYAEGNGALAQPLADEHARAPAENIEAARARVVELDARLELAREQAPLHVVRKPDDFAAFVTTLLDAEAESTIDRRKLPEEPMTLEREGPSDFRPPLRAASIGFEHAARVVDLVLGALLGYFVDEPTLTPQQVHDTTRAYAERDESRAVDAAKWDNAAALDAVNVQINHNRSPVHAGAGDEPTRADSIYDRYPGLTRDDNDGERTREDDRAFYDTGIERSR